MSGTTAAMRSLRAANVAFDEHPYTYQGREDVGMTAARAIGVEPHQLFKTLVVVGDGQPVLVLVPSSGEASLADVARVLRFHRRCEMANLHEAERQTGYLVGGISPLGTRRHMKAVIDASIQTLDRVYVNGGRRGLILGLASVDLLRVLDPVVHPVSR